MLLTTVNASQLEELIEKNEIVFVDFWAEWCAPCKQFGKIYEKVAAENPSVVFAKINIENEGSLAETFNIRSIPHLLVFKQGIVVYSESGSIPESALKELVEQAIAVDVSSIRSEIDEEKQ
ncbi:MAG: thioredoxin family protein [Legionella sp.]|nr:thioredoxin family protein [Legionella sp.]